VSRAAARRPSRATAARPAGTGPTRRTGRFGRLSTGRIAVLVLVVVTLVVSAALPLREFLSQRGEIAELAAANAAAGERVEALAAERKRLDDPAHIAAEARRRLHFVLPGETAYIVIPPEPAAEPDPDADSPWYSQLWDSVGDADRPVAAPAQRGSVAPRGTADPAP
jgi:cell division protein FtsB